MEQTNLFEFLYPRYKIDKPIRLIELFAGIGSQAKALERIGVNFEHYRAVEFDKFAIKSYNAIHGTKFETSDIRNIHADDLNIVDTDAFTYLLTYSFPCQDLSLAGKRKGMTKGSNTRSGLLWEVERLLDECNELPQILLMENVPEVIGKKNIEDFKKWQYKLETFGYKNYVQLLNAKDYGIPQNRNRCFMVSILGIYSYSFPKAFKLDKFLMDMLEDEVDDKYYLSEKQIKKLKVKIPTKISNTIRSSGRGSTERHAWDLVSEVIQIGNCMSAKNRENPNQGKIYDVHGLSPTLTCFEGGNRQPMIIDCCEGIYTGASERFQKGGLPGLSRTIKGEKHDAGAIIGIFIRRLTPLECWRLMGFDDEDFYKAKAAGISDTQLYKQAGNSIVVPVLEAIFKELQN